MNSDFWSMRMMENKKVEIFFLGTISSNRKLLTAFKGNIIKVYISGLFYLLVTKRKYICNIRIYHSTPIIRNVVGMVKWLPHFQHFYYILECGH